MICSLVSYLMIQSPDYKRMAPPTYGDLGKQARDLFSKNYRKQGIFVKLKPPHVDRKNLSHPMHDVHVDKQEQDQQPQPKTNIFISLIPSIHPRSRFVSPSSDSTTIDCDDDSTQTNDAMIDLGLVKLDVKTKTPSGVDFNVNCTSNNDTGRVNSALETKYLLKDYGLTLREKWTTDNILTSEVTLEDKPLSGLKVSGNCSFAPQSGKKTGIVKAAFKTDALHVNTDVDLDYAGAILHGAAVLGYVSFTHSARPFVSFI